MTKQDIVLLKIVKNSEHKLSSRSDQGEDRLYAEKQKNLQCLWHCLLSLL